MREINLFTERVDIDDLKQGETLTYDIYLLNGSLLLKAGVQLTEKHISRLKKMKNMLVKINIKKVYQNTIIASRNLMYKAAKGQAIKRKEVKTIIEPYIGEIEREKNIVKLLQNLRSKDEYTYQHSINIGIISMYLGKWLGYDKKEQMALAIAGTLHDIGKSRIPLNILNKPAFLTPLEYEIIKKHAKIGYEILESSHEYEEDITLAVLQHHEREDGKGYPQGLKGEEIHPFAKIVAVADTYHAMTSDRVYKKKVNPFMALDHLSKNLSHLNSLIVFKFVEKMLDFYTGGTVQLSNGQTGQVIYIDKNNLKYPIIKLNDTQRIVDLKGEEKIKLVQVLES